VSPKTEVFLWAALFALVAGVTAPTLHDPPYWDANVYVHQGHFAATHHFAMRAYREFPDVLKPPVFATLLLGVAGRRPLAQHLVVLVFAFATLLGVRALVLALGGDRKAALIGGAFVAASALFLAQAGLVQSDLPMTAFATWAWALLLGDNLVGWFVLSTLAVLTKESAYFLCAPALAFLWLRDRNAWATLKKIAVPAWPGIVLVAWLAGLHLLRGHAIPKLNRDALGANFILDSAIHEFVEGGRIALVVAAVFALRRTRTPALLATALAVAALPLAMPAPLPRYMLAGLPPLAALAALGVRDRPRAALAVAALLAMCWFGPSLHANGGHHLDSNLFYRSVLKTERQVVEAVAAEHPRAVAATFPFYFAFSDPPAEGWLAEPIPTVLLDARTATADLCHADFLIDADQSAPADEPRARLQSALVPWRTFGRPGFAVRVFRLDCGNEGHAPLP
jgi:hypothetical protein